MSQKIKANKQSTKETIIALEKHSKKTKKNLFNALASQLRSPRKNRAEVNLFELNELAKKFKDKMFVVPGKVLAYGELNEKIEVAALNASSKAKEKISKNGKFISLRQLAESNAEAKKLMIVK